MDDFEIPSLTFSMRKNKHFKLEGEKSQKVSWSKYNGLFGTLLFKEGQFSWTFKIHEVRD